MTDFIGRLAEAYKEVHQFFRPRQRMAKKDVSLSDRRAHFLKRGISCKRSLRPLREGKREKRRTSDKI